MTTAFDYVIVGSGAAGSVLAERLSASGAHSVLVIEAGPSDRNSLHLVPGAWPAEGDAMPSGSTGAPTMALGWNAAGIINSDRLSNRPPSAAEPHSSTITGAVIPADGGATGV